MFGKKKKNEQEENKVEEQNVEEKKENQEEKKTVKKGNNKHLFLRTSSLLLSLALLGFSFYCISIRIIDGKNNSSNKNSYLTLTNKSVSESKAIYAKFGKEKEKKAKDFAFVGTKFFLSENKITPFSLTKEAIFNQTDYTNLSLYDLTHNTTKVNASNFSDGKYYIDFNKVSEGDYLIYPFDDEGNISVDSEYQFYSFQKEEALSYSLFTLPDEKGERMKVTFKNNNLSPYSVFYVKNSGSTLPSDYYDAVLFYQEYKDGKQTSISEESLTKLKSITSSINEEGRYKVYACSSLEEACNMNSTLSIALSPTQEDITTSLFTKGKNEKTSVLEDGELKGYDSIPEIREPLGKLAKAGESYYGVLGNNTVIKKESYIGKESFLLHDEKADILSLIDSL